MSLGTSRGSGGPRKYAHNFEAAREREMHLYLPYWGYSTSEKFAQQSAGNRPNASRDNVLTVFAQLASLRLDAKRALISLFDRTTQHIVAEATPRLSLRGAKDDDKSLWQGVQQLPRENIPMCNMAMQTFTKNEGKSFFVPDLTQDPRFQSHNSVTGSPHNRFYVSVPIRSPDDYVIGSVAVLDDEPRVAMTEEQTQFLQELSLTVMDHLMSQRAMREEDREERMVRALGLFVQGKSNLTEGISSVDHSEQTAGHQLAEIDQKLENFQISDDVSKVPESSTEELPPDQTNGQHNGQEKGGRGRVAEITSSAKNQTVTESGKNSRSRSPVQLFKRDESKLRDSEERDENERRPPLSPTTGQLQEKLAPSSVQNILERASRLMNQALDVEGVMFLDASVYARRQMLGPTNGKRESGPRDFEIEHETQTHWESMGDESSGPKSLVLGYSTSSSASSEENDQQARHYLSLPGAFISHLIEKYPRGKIFHIEDDGSVAVTYEGLADDVSQAYFIGGKKVAEASAEEKDIRQENMDIKYLHRALPGARCIGIYPVWDFQRGRWFTVNLVWSNDPGRVLSEPKDLTYVAAFSNSVMAEVSRMDLEAADRAKGAFISSISHELRSPLHGVLGTVELLQESVNTYSQRGLVETIHSCGRTLLDTLNHLLDYAKINTLTQSQASGGENMQTNRSVAKAAVPGVIQDQNLSSLVQEVVEGLIAGREFLDREGDYAPGLRNRDRKSSRVSENGDDRSQLLTVVDIEWQENWHYSVYAGAWRRIVMNLFGNALKYTDAGYVRLFMKQDTISVHDEILPAVRITIADSGRGMSQDYLLHNLYTPFIQEDNQSPGLGVGLSLVHQIVNSLSGRIEIRSKVGQGTEVDVVLPISGPESIPVSKCPFLGLQKCLKGKSVSFFTKSFERGNLGIKQEVFSDIRSSLTRMVQDWFDLEVLDLDELDQKRPDFLIVTENEYRAFAHSPENSDIRQSMEPQHAYPLIVLSGHTGNWKVVKENSRDRAIFLSQPVSPKTLEKVFKYCLDNQGIEFDEEDSISPPLVESHEVQQISGMGFNNLGSTDPEINESHNGDDSGSVPDDRPKVLLVEDNPVNLKIIEACVKNSKLPYKTAVNGLEALNKYKAERFDAVIMDISMPVMDGLSATREMRHFEKMANLDPSTIIILTAFLSAETQQEAAISGVNEFLTKPTPLKQLKKMLQNLPRRKPPST